MYTRSSRCSARGLFGGDSEPPNETSVTDNVTAGSKCKRFVQEVKTDLARQGLMDLG
jgi:hypothetical protein